MKTLLTILSVALFGAMVSANPGNKTDYIVTKDGKVVVAKVQLGALKINAKNFNGETMKVNYKDVLTFKKNDEVYTKKPLYEGKKNTGEMVFMRLISWRNGLSLYCYSDLSSSKESSKRYFVFKDENTLWLEVDSRNAENIRKFFSKQ